MRVMVGIDDSDESLYALRWAIDNLFRNGSTGLADGGEAGSLILVHVQQPQPSKSYVVAPSAAFPAVPGAAAYPSPALVDSERKSQKISAGILARALKMCNDKINVQTLILEGDPKDMICETSEKLNVDLLIVGSRGLGMIRRAFSGSVSDYCARHAKCPTLIVKLPNENREG